MMFSTALSTESAIRRTCLEPNDGHQRPALSSGEPRTALWAALSSAPCTLPISTTLAISHPMLLQAGIRLPSYPKYTTHRRSAYRAIRDSQHSCQIVGG